MALYRENPSFLSYIIKHFDRTYPSCFQLNKHKHMYIKKLNLHESFLSLSLFFDMCTEREREREREREECLCVHACI